DDAHRLASPGTLKRGADGGLRGIACLDPARAGVVVLGGELRLAGLYPIAGLRLPRLVAGSAEPGRRGAVGVERAGAVTLDFVLDRATEVRRWVERGVGGLSDQAVHQLLGVGKWAAHLVHILAALVDLPTDVWRLSQRMALVGNGALGCSLV